VVDASWALASDGQGGFDRHVLFGSSAVQYVAWVAGTIVGVLGGSAIGDLETLGLDAVYPAFFLALLIAELRSARASRVAAAGALIALVLIPFTPPGIPVLAASLATLIGLVGREAEAA
jgi:predicted branched-subunit amino acid permease